jgi:hypothetical protein
MLSECDKHVWPKFTWKIIITITITIMIMIIIKKTTILIIIILIIEDIIYIERITNS